jgi:hypothetical protein
MVELKLKRKYKYDSRKRVFESGSGTRFDPHRDLPKGTSIVSQGAGFGRGGRVEAFAAEKESRRYMQLILPQGVAPLDFVDVVHGWPGVERPRSARTSACRTPGEVSLDQSPQLANVNVDVEIDRADASLCAAMRAAFMPASVARAGIADASQFQAAPLRQRA